MAAVIPKGHSNAGTPGTSTWTVTPTGSPVSGDLMAIAVTSDSTANLVSSVSNLGAGALVFSTTDGTGSATLILGVYNGSAPVMTLSSAWGANHGKLAWTTLDQTVYASWGTPGTVFNRSSSQSTTTAPSTGSSAAPNLVFWWDKTTSQSSCSTGITDIENVLPTSGFAGSVCISTYDDAAGVATQTATYGIASANGKGVQVPVNLAAMSASTSASFSTAVTLTASATPAENTNADFSTAVTLSATVGVVATASFSTAVTLTASAVPAENTTAGFSTAVTLTAVATPHLNTTAAFSTAVTLAGHVSGPVDVITNAANWPMNWGHFGDDGDVPPGLVLAAYDQAARWNAAMGFEVDVWPTTDGVWVVQHDNTTDTNFGTSGNVITSSTWASISSLTTTVGGYPIMRLDTLLAAYPNRAMMIDNKGQLSMPALLNILDAAGGAKNFIVKGFCTSTSWADAGTARGYQSWGYYYHADVATNLPATQSHWSMLGMDALSTTTPDWTAVLAYGKPVIAHIIATAAQKTTAVGFGANGFMASGVMEVVPQTPVAAAFSTNVALTATATPHENTVAAFGVNVALTASTSAQGFASAALTVGVTLTATATPNFATAANFALAVALSAIVENAARDLTLAAIPGKERWASIPSTERWTAIPARERWSAIPEVS